MTLAIIDGDVLLYMAMWNQPTLGEAKTKFKDIFDNILEHMFTDDYVMAFGGPNNFRDELYIDYKKSTSRSKSRSTKPEWFDDLKSHCVNDYEGAILTDGYEADDIVRIWSTEATEAGIDHVVVSVDKDLDCIEGKHLNPRSMEFYEVTKEYAEKHYWKQILMGDSVDNIPGVAGIGPKKADILLGYGTDHKEMKAAVCKAYHARYLEDGYDYLVTNGRLIHIWRKLGDHFKIDRSFYEEAISND